jgi:Ca2+-binding EF-hand superfamily protein
MGKPAHGRKFMTVAAIFFIWRSPAKVDLHAITKEANSMPIAPLFLLLSAAQLPAAAPPAPAAPSGERHWRRLFISPMGEPFHPAGRDDDALADWFRQADRNHDGRLTLDEMQQDAERFFASLDVAHDGEIDPDDITRYETVIAPEISSGPHLEMAALDAGSSDEGNQRGGARGGHGGGHRGGGGGGSRWRNQDDNESHQGAARYGLIDLPEPVVSADSDFNRGVSLSEFRNAAAQRFIALDIDHHGFLTLAELESIRPAPSPTAHKPEASSGSSAESAPPPQY